MADLLPFFIKAVIFYLYIKYTTNLIFYLFKNDSRNYRSYDFEHRPVHYRSSSVGKYMVQTLWSLNSSKERGSRRFSSS